MSARVWSMVLAIAGAVGVIAGVTGLLLKAEPVVTTSAEVHTRTLVIPPEMIAFSRDSDIVVSGPGILDAYTGRPGDMEQWARYEQASELAGISSWESLVVNRMYQYGDDGGGERTTDLFRSHTGHVRDYFVNAASVPVGESVVVVSRVDAPLESVSIELRRNVGYGWAWPVLSVGALALAAGLVLLAIRWIDLRPQWAAVEERTTKARKAVESRWAALRTRLRRQPRDEEGGQ